MNLSDLNVEKIKPLNAFAILSAVFAFLAGGLFLALYKPSLFLSLDYFRLIILSVAIPAPLISINSILFFYLFRNKVRNLTEEINHQKITGGILIGSVFTILIFYFAYVLEFFFDWGIKTGVLIISISELLVFLLLFYSAFWSNNESENK
jgi:hypothetical protein